MFAPDQPLAMTLSAAEWNVVMSIMREAPMPYRVSAPIIAALARQFDAALPRANGAHPPSGAPDAALAPDPAADGEA